MIPSQVVTGKKPASSIDTKEDEDTKEGKDTETTEFHGMESSNAQCRNDTVGDLTEQMTKFLALDKCLPRRQFLSILNLPVVTKPEEEKQLDKEKVLKDDEVEGSQSRTYELQYDPEWLAVLRKTHDLNSPDRRRVEVPTNLVSEGDDFHSEVELVIDRLKEKQIQEGEDHWLTIPKNFTVTVPIYSDVAFHGRCPPLPLMGNPQTE